MQGMQLLHGNREELPNVWTDSQLMYVDCLTRALGLVYLGKQNKNDFLKCFQPFIDKQGNLRWNII